MKSSPSILIVVFLAGLSGGYALHFADSPAPSPVENVASNCQIDSAFSPNQGATDLVIDVIGKAKNSVRLAGYSFTSMPVTDALVRAHDRGVDVQVVVDESNRHSKISKVDILQRHGIPVRLNDRFAIMHDKFIVVDGDTVESGSFNYTAAAENHNAENVLVIHSNPGLAMKYLAQWQQIWNGGSEP